MAVRLPRAVWGRLWEHKKKAAFFAAASIATVNFARNRLEERKIFHDYCLKAREYGREAIGPLENPRQVTVLVGDEFRNQKTWRKFEKFALPLLHYGGLKVDVAELASLYKDVAQKEWKASDTLYIVGKDSEISNIMNFMLDARDMDVRDLRRAAKQIPKLAFFPAGCDSHVAEQLLPRSYPLVRWCCESAMGVIAGVARSGSVIKCKVDEKPAYLAISCLHVGDIGETGDLKYSVFRKVKERWFYLHKALTHRDSENLRLSLEYAEPCYGCKRCSHADHEDLTRPWWSRLFFWRNAATATDSLATARNDVVNEKCGEKVELALSTCEMSAFNNLRSDEPKLNIAFGPEYMDKWNYLVEAWHRVSSGRPYLTADSPSVQKAVEASECIIELTSKNSLGENESHTVVIDGEPVEASTVSLQVIPNIFRLVGPLPKAETEVRP